MEAMGGQCREGLCGQSQRVMCTTSTHSSGLNSVTGPHGAVWDLQLSHGARRKEREFGETQRVLATSVSKITVPSLYYSNQIGYSK